MVVSNLNLKNYLQKVLNNQKLESHLELCLDYFSFLKLSKNDYFVEEGTVCSYFCFIESGILQHSISVPDGEKTTYLALKNSPTSALKSFINKAPSRKNIKAISNCELWVLTLDNFNYLLQNNEAFHTFYYNLIENQIFLIDDYRIDLLTLSPEERYRKMLANEPNLLLQVPLHYLASFLGISSRHMSRIRKNII